METKECRHCRQPIYANARRCQYCQGMQGWFSDQKDPRVFVMVFIPLTLFIVVVFAMSREGAKPIAGNDRKAMQAIFGSTRVLPNAVD